MITRLKKYTFLVYHREYENLLNQLREAGVVHIIEKGTGGQEHPASDLVASLKRYDEYIRIIKRHLPEKITDIPVVSGSNATPGEVADTIENLLAETEDLKNRIQSLRNEAAKLEPWGDYDTDGFEKILRTGWKISLFTCPAKKFRDDWHKKYSIQIINQDKGKYYFAVIHRPCEEIDIDAEPEKPGEKSAPVLLREAEASELRMDEIKKQLTHYSQSWLELLKNGRVDMLNRVEYRVAESQLMAGADGKLTILQGWVPESQEDKIKYKLADKDVYFYQSDPEPGDKVPVMLRNNSFATLFEPISKLFDLPNYKELDLTPFFAPFFMMFFGFCIGDAGYGLLFLALGFLLYRKMPVAIRPFLSLAKYLGIATIIFGIISGTFFGINLIDSGYKLTDEGLSYMKSYRVPKTVIADLETIKGEFYLGRGDYLIAAKKAAGNEAVETYRNAILKSAEGNFSIVRSFRHIMQDSLSMFYLAIMIGALQIIFGMILKIINITKQKGFRHSLSTVGWVLFLLTLIIFKGGEAAGIISGEASRPFFLALMAAAGILIFLLNDLSINIFFRIGSGIWDTYGTVTGVFGDLLSYIRLFALGICSSILGFVFNDISSEFLNIPYIGWLPFLILLLIGHTINIFMAALGAFIHPMRLTFVEFYKNAGFTGGGKAFKPFRINN